MSTARSHGVAADKAVIILLESMLKDEAERANNDGEKLLENTGSSY